MTEIKKTIKKNSKKLSLLIGVLFLSIFSFGANINLFLYKSNCLNSDPFSIQLQSEEYYMVAGAVGVDDYLEGMILDHDENVLIYGVVGGKIGFFRHDTDLKPPLNSSDYAIWGSGVPSKLSFDSSGNIYIAGYSYPNLYLIKYNSNLEFMWNRTWGDDATCYDMVIDSNNNIFVAGHNNGDALLSKFDTMGNELWNFSAPNAYYSMFAFDYFDVLVKDSNDNIYFAYLQYEFNIEGYIDGPIYRILKLDNSGTLLLNFSYIPSDYINNLMHLRMVSMDSSENLYLLGKYVDTSRRVHIVKYNNMGIQLWNQTYDFYGQSEYVYSYITMKFDSMGNLFLLQSANYIALAKINPNSGNLIWETPYTSDTGERCYDIAFDTQNNAFVVGRVSNSETGERDVLIKKYNSNGALLGKKTWDHNGNETGLGIAITSKAEIFLTGTADSFFSSDYDLFLLKINPISTPDQLIIIIIIVSIITTGAVVGLVIFLLSKKKARKINPGE